MDKLQFFWLWYNKDRKNNIESYNLGQYLDFSDLKIDYLPQEMLQESCIYFSNIDSIFDSDTSHVAFASARYKDKFSQYNDPNVINLPHSTLLEIISQQKVQDYLPFHTNGVDWYLKSELYHPGINKFIDQFINIIECDREVLNFDLGMSNSFMIKKELFLKTADIFRNGVEELYKINSEIIFGDCGFKNRALGCLWERLSGIAAWKSVYN